MYELIVQQCVSAHACVHRSDSRVLVLILLVRDVAMIDDEKMK